MSNIPHHLTVLLYDLYRSYTSTKVINATVLSMETLKLTISHI